MRIGINARTLVAPQLRGWTRYTAELLRHLPEFGAELVLFCDQPLREEHLALLQPGSFRLVQAPPLPYLAWEQGWLPFACMRERVQLLHAPANFGLPLLARCPTILTLHDAIDVAFPSPHSPSVRETLVRGSFRAARLKANQIITVSHHAKADIVKHFGVAGSRVTVISEASDLAERAGSADDEREAVRHLGLPPGPFVLYAGGFEERKNVAFLLEAFALAALENVNLVLVGSNPTAEFQRIAKARETSRTLFTGFIPDVALAGLYRRALVFVYPSLYEGFGLQLCEAMSFGCPTLAADATSLPEVLGGGGDTFSPHQVQSLAALLRRVALEPAYRENLAGRARQRAQAFSWRKTAELTAGVYRSTASLENP